MRICLDRNLNLAEHWTFSVIIPPMDCPKCKLVNPPTAKRCDCGYDFETHTMEESYLTERDKQLSKPKMAGAIFATVVLVKLIFALVRGAREQNSFLLL